MIQKYSKLKDRISLLLKCVSNFFRFVSQSRMWSAVTEKIRPSDQQQQKSNRENKKFRKIEAKWKEKCYFSLNLVCLKTGLLSLELNEDQFQNCLIENIPVLLFSIYLAAKRTTQFKTWCNRLKVKFNDHCQRFFIETFSNMELNNVSNNAQKSVFKTPSNNASSTRIAPNKMHLKQDAQWCDLQFGASFYYLTLNYFCSTSSVVYS